MSVELAKEAEGLVSLIHKQDERSTRECKGRSSSALLQSGALDLGSSDDAENKKYRKLYITASKD